MRVTSQLQKEASRERTLTRSSLALILVLVIAGAAFGYYISQNIVKNPTSVRSSSNSTIDEETTLPYGSAEFAYPTTDLNSTISLAYGEGFVIQLNASSASTGYNWKVATSPGIEYHNYTVVATSARAGGPQTRDYKFRAAQPGNQSITLQYEQPFAPHDVFATINLEVDVTPPPTMLSYNFPVNSTGGYLFVVLKNYQNQSYTVTDVSLDNVSFTGQSLSLGSGCGNFTLGVECDITLDFGGAHPPPTEGTNHILGATTESGGELTYEVTAGTLYKAQCVYTSSC
jgi:predicted secreted protein